MSFIVRKATEEDALPIQHFVVKTGLAAVPATVDWTTFLIAENEKGEFAAVVRIQKVSERTGLIRTLIMDSEKITNLFVLEFLEATLHYASNEGIESIYLMAAREASFFQQLGFEQIGEQEVPEGLKMLEDVNNHLKKQLPIFVKK